MSKRHRKTKLFAEGADHSDPYEHDLSYEAPKGKKPKGRQRRQSHKRAYYDES